MGVQHRGCLSLNGKYFKILTTRQSSRGMLAEHLFYLQRDCWEADLCVSPAESVQEQLHLSAHGPTRGMAPVWQRQGRGRTSPSGLTSFSPDNHQGLMP